jgi:ABC-type multidrug transport system fused ATPase/permease subunit
MQAVAYHRARQLLSSRHDQIVARILGCVDSLLIVVLLHLVALLVALLSFRGEARFPAARKDSLPKWAALRSELVLHDPAGQVPDLLIFDDTGIFPLIAENLLSPNPVHRFGAHVLNGVTAVLPTLRNNLGALCSILAMGLVSLVLIVLVSQWRRQVMARGATEVATALRRQIHRQMYRLGQSSLPTEGVGPVINLWTREVNDVRDGLFADLNVTPRVQVLGAGFLVLAVLVSPILTLFLASLGGLVWLTARRIERDARRASDAAIRDASVQLCLLHEDLGLLRTVRVYGVEEYDRKRFDEHLERFLRADQRRLVTSSRLNPSTVLLFGAALAIALLLLGYNVVVIGRISIATMLILFVSLTGLAYPITEWLRLQKAIRQANRSASGIFEFLERKPELHQTVGAQFVNPVKEQIALEHVTLESRSGRILLDGASTEIPAGARTAILGLDDDARLALVCLIPRLIDPKSGRVFIDGKDLREMTLDSIRAQVATVLQADLVFTDTVLANIGLGEPMNTLPRVIDAAKLTHAHHFIQDLPHGYDTIIGPLGHYLKPDEQFRIALARACLHDPSILIVEEPDVPIDHQTRHFIDDTLSRLSIGRTLILIPHRLSSVRASDHVILLQNGHVEESGSPNTLQSESKLYRHVIYTEFNEFATGEIDAAHLSHAEVVRRGAPS